MTSQTLNCNGRLINIDHPLIMGILNITPDSFYLPSAIMETEKILSKVATMMAEGADIIDIGGMSTRPGAEWLTWEKEWNRLKSPIKAIRLKFPDILLSVDTFRSEVAQRAADEGIDLINDISAGSLDEQMFATVGRLHLPYIAMHMQGTPQNMQQNPHYEHVVREIFDYFIGKINQMEDAGIRDIIIDPGFGFGKTVLHNYQLLKGLETFQLLEKPLLVGVSRKSMIYKLLKTDPEHALNGTSILNQIALEKGAHILRVHDIREAKECVQIQTFMEQA